MPLPLIAGVVVGAGSLYKAWTEATKASTDQKADASEFTLTNEEKEKTRMRLLQEPHSYIGCQLTLMGKSNSKFFSVLVGKL